MKAGASKNAPGAETFSVAARLVAVAATPPAASVPATNWRRVSPGKDSGAHQRAWIEQRRRRARSHEVQQTLPAETAEQPPEARFESSAAEALVHAHAQRDRKRERAEFRGIELVRVAVEHERRGLHRAPRESKADRRGQEPEVAAAA